VPNQQENNQPPNLIFYEVLTGKLDTGAEIMVQLFRKPDGTITLAQFALRKDRWETWGVPHRLNHMGVHPTDGGVA
jgi:hypothetical protein